MNDFNVVLEMPCGYDIQPHHCSNQYPTTKKGEKMMSVLQLRRDIGHDEPNLTIVPMIEDKISNEPISIKI